MGRAFNQSMDDWWNSSYNDDDDADSDSSPINLPLYRSLANPRLACILTQKNSRRLELSILKNTPHGRWGEGPGSVDPPVPEILEFVAFRDSGKIIQQFSRNFPGTFLQNSRTDPRNSHSLLEFSD